MDNRAGAAEYLAARLLALPWTPSAIASEIDRSLSFAHSRTRRALTDHVLRLAAGTYPPAPHALAAFLVDCRFFRPPRDAAVAIALDSPRFAPIPAFANLPIPPLATLGELGEWLGQPADQLDWLAGVRRDHSLTFEPSHQHYHYDFISRPQGGFRLIEAPKPRLKAMQRRILRDILDNVPVHDRAHGFVRGRSCLSGAQVHAGEAVVATFDLARFFPSIGRPRIHGVFRCLGYPWAVARSLAGLCTTQAPAGVLRRLPRAQRPDGAIYRVPHLPQGAPTSPALANLLAWRTDSRLQGLARAAGANYTRYADDIAFSGDDDFAAGLGRFAKAVETILDEEGFSLNAAKTRIVRRSERQRVTGIVVNEHCNTGRAEFDNLKATLFNCARTGPVAQNRAGVPAFRSHLDGRVNWVEQVNPARGAKLRRLFEKVDWGVT